MPIYQSFLTESLDGVIIRYSSAVTVALYKDIMFLLQYVTC